MNNVDWNNKDNNWSLEDETQTNDNKANSKSMLYIFIGVLGVLLLFVMFFLILKNSQKEYSIKSDQLQLIIGKTYKVKEKGDYEFKIDNVEIAKVDSKGTISPLKEGTTNLTVTDDKNIKVIILNVVKSGKKKDEGEVVDEEPKEAKIIEINSIEISNKEVTVVKGNKVQLEVVINPTNASNKELKWASDNANVSVDSTGVVLGNQVGNSIVTVTTSNGKSATCNVKVVEPTSQTIGVSSVTLNATQKDLQVGQTFELMATINPNNATNKTVTWTSSDESVASVSNGMVTAKKGGTAIITVTTSNGKSATCRIVVQNNPVTSINLNKTELMMKLNDTYQLVATISPDNATDKTITWTSSDESVASVSNGIVTAKKGGTAIIVASASNGKTASCEVKVYNITK